MWNTNLLRLTFFVDSQNLIKELESDEYWTSVANVEPMKEFDPKLQILKYSAQLEEENIDIILQVGINRVDWLLKVKEDINSFERKLNSIGAIKDSIEKISIFRKPIIKGLPQKISRIAFGSISFDQVDDDASALAILNSFLPMDISQFKEFAISVNKQTSTTINKQKVAFNNIVKLEEFKLQGQRIESGKLIDIGQIISPKLETDVSTPTINTFGESFFFNNIEEIIDYLIKRTIELSKTGIK